MPSRRKRAIGGAVDVAEEFQRFEEAADVFALGAVEVPGDLFDGERPAGLLHDDPEGLGALFEFGGPRQRPIRAAPKRSKCITPLP